MSLQSFPEGTNQEIAVCVLVEFDSHIKDAV